MFISLFTLIIALFFSINIGASGSAATMGSVYGGGAIRKRRTALILASIFILLGAVLGGKAVVKTIGSGIISSDLITAQITLIILLSACLTLFLANLLGIPLSTSEVTVGSVIGVGVAYQSLIFGKIIFIVSMWLILPFIAFAMTYTFGKCIHPFFKKRLGASIIEKLPFGQKGLSLILIAAGCYEAFSAGMNNVGNVIGPLVGSHFIDINRGVWFGGIFIAIGAIFLGSRTLETNAKKITKLTLIHGSAVSFTSGFLVMLASFLGLPVPLTQATTAGIFGIRLSTQYKSFGEKGIIKQILKIWITSPISSLVLSYFIVETFVKHNAFDGFVVISAIITAIGYMSLYKAKASVKKAQTKVNC